MVYFDLGRYFSDSYFDRVGYSWEEQEMNILVTGDKGFLGTHLVKKLQELKHNVTGMDIKEDGDIRSQKDCLEKTQKQDVVIHLAALTDVQDSLNSFQRGSYNYHQTNVTGTVQLLNACVFNGVKRFVFASSAAVNDIQSPYGCQKLCGELYCDVFRKCYGLSTVSLRFFNIYGKGTEKGVIPLWISKIKRGESPVINGDGEQIRDFVYVNDVVDSIITAMESKLVGVFEVGTGLGTSILELCDTLLTEMKSNVKIKFGKGLEGEIRESISDKKKWLPKYKPQYLLIEKGIREMIK
jgi:nucleoside-diphosphate-sugar epimerase